MTHTPGPWKVQALHVEGQEIILRTHGEMTIGAPEAYAVASVPLRHVSINGQLANARLIAAAPKMLAALEKAAEFIRDQYEGRCPLTGGFLADVAEPIWGILSEAIAEARSGESDAA